LGHSPTEKTSPPRFSNSNVDIKAASPGGVGRVAQNAALATQTASAFDNPYIDAFADDAALVRTGGTGVPTCQLPTQEMIEFKGSRLVQSWSLLEKIQRLCRPEKKEERGPAVCGCGRPPNNAKHVNIHLRQGSVEGEVQAGVSGVLRCDSPWLCPPCSMRLARERIEKVLEVTRAAYDQGGAVAMVALTARHTKATALIDIMALIKEASSAARKGRAWIRASEAYGILGVIVGQEVELSEKHGWHYHQHLAVVVGGPTDEEFLASDYDDDRLAEIVHERALAAGKWVEDAYRKEIRASGYRVHRRKGCRTHVADDAQKAARYTAKGSAAWSFGDQEDATKADVLTPWDLALEAADGEPGTKRTAWAFAKWKEYEAAISGTRSCVVSAALKKKLGLRAPEKVSDADGGSHADAPEPQEQHHHERDSVVGTVEAPIWARWMNYGLASTFLRRVEYGGTAGFAEARRETERDSDVISARIGDESIAELRERIRTAEAERWQQIIERDEREKLERQREIARLKMAVAVTHHRWDIKEGDPSSALLIAGERLRQHVEAFGQRKCIRPIVEDMAASYGVHLTEAEVLKAANAATEFEREFERLCEGRWLSAAEVAAIRPVALKRVQRAPTVHCY
jgi:hypothetical protein